MQTEKQLIEQCLKNDRKAQQNLFDRFAPILLAVCIRYTKDRAEAEDVLQEVFVKIFKRLKQFEDKGSFEGWLKRITVNTAITYYRKNLKHAYHDDVSEIKGPNIINNKYKEAEFTHNELLDVIRTLPGGYKMVFNMFAIEGYKHKEIAEKLSIDISTSKSQYYRARKLIQQKLIELQKINT